MAGGDGGGKFCLKKGVGGGGGLLRFGAGGEVRWHSRGAMVRWLASKNHSDL